MQFNSHIFIIYFLPIVTATYFLVNRIKPVLGKIVLIVAGVLFFSLGRWGVLIWLCVSMLVNYLLAIMVRKMAGRKKSFVVSAIVFNIVFLFCFKYTNFVIGSVNFVFDLNIPLWNIILPLGISFYTFQQISYVVSVANGELKDVNLIDYMVFILYLPKILMGPLMEPIDFIAQLNDGTRKKVDINNIAGGLKLFSIGLIKKALVADTLAKSVDWTFLNIAKATPLECLLTILFYSLEIYYDFSGYSDMAVGISMMLNIDLPINFDSPYRALSIRDFWKRWHISLTKFFTKYIYIPLGGSKRGTSRTLLNTMIVFAISGLWHGANWTFVVWGIVHGMFSCADRMIAKVEDKIWKPIRWLMTFVTVSILWLLFRAGSFAEFADVIKGCFAIGNYTVCNEFVESFGTSLFKPVISIFNNLGIYITPTHMMIIATAVFLGLCWLPVNAYAKRKELSGISMFGTAIAFACAMLCLSSESMFVYFGF